MATKKQTDTKLSRKDHELKLTPDETKEQTDRKHADILVSSEFSALRVMISASGNTKLWENVDTTSIAAGLRDQAKAVNNGDLSYLESMLTNQASALQSLFTRMVVRANDQTQMSHLEGFMRIALKAQNQCRSTIETLSTIKNPPVIYAKESLIYSTTSICRGRIW